MSKVCALTGKKPLSGNNVSHSKRHTRRVQNPNLQKKRLVNPATGKIEVIKISTSGMRTLAKWDKAGKTYDLRKLN
ncbi:50S ribosomal protein L28 [Candidatus Uhrbacteria bacterium]|nr:50S ribosomal protein L28 [Candidatus Uhrbacteria bacterium]